MAALGSIAAMVDESGDDALISACREGDRDAFHLLFERHQRRVWSIAWHFTGNEAASRDITQQVFLKLFHTIRQFRTDSNFSTWLYRLVVNACLDERRKWRRFLSLDALKPREMAWIPAADLRLGEQQMAEAVRRAVAALSPKLRIVILLKHFDELSYDEMSEALGCSKGTVASRLNRGHKELARTLEHLRGELR
jgi:RNA polymerase sigma-70 factor (ECF subfamily)